jgi:DNA repair protein SbcC/Rad50
MLHNVCAKIVPRPYIYKKAKTMIPIKLVLRNFMCYRDNVPAINFESIHTACISGANGHGKSALIDAITWALWGQTRAASDDELVHSGQLEAEVDFDFTVSGQRYQIVRKHNKPRNQKSSGQTILEFRMVTPDGMKILTGDTVAQTQQKIIQTLHMDYDTFVNSAFIRQGHSNEFTRKRAGERKQVLSNILQLELYDALEENAKALSKLQQNTIDQLETLIHGIKEELVRQPEYLAEFENAQLELQKEESLSAELEVQLTSLRKEKELLENKKAQLNEITAHLQDSERNYNLWTEQAHQCRSRILGYETVLSHQEDIERGHQDYLEMQKSVQELDQKAKQYHLLTQAKHRLEMAIVKAGEEINRSHAVAENRIRDLEASAEKLPGLQQSLKELEIHIKKIEEADEQNQTKRMRSQEIQSRSQWLQSEELRLKTALVGVEEKIKMLSHQAGATCPLCESEIGEEGQKRIEAKYKNERNEIAENLRLNLLENKAISTNSLTLVNEIQQNELKLKQARDSAQAKRGQLVKAVEHAMESSHKCQEERLLLEEIERRLSTRDFASFDQDSLTRIEKEITELAYDYLRHEQLKMLAADLEKYEASMRKLEEAARLIKQEKITEEQACRTAEELRDKIEKDSSRQQSLSFELKEMPIVYSELQIAENKYQTRLTQQKSIREVMGGAKARLDRLNDLEKRVKDKSDELSEAVKQDKLYKDLAQAFGKKGLQAMLIEMAIPEIELEANQLLARMTDNRMHIKLETQRATKKGDVQETLDINISDELGTRNYEMFSGGEAFRIDFAIRIALSKLLARRAGAPLPTLIIDEGFGTQDANGIDKIKEAVTSIQDDFEKILVITHINDFKDAFPQQIEVVKTAEGSTVCLS